MLTPEASFEGLEDINWPKASGPRFVSNLGPDLVALAQIKINTPHRLRPPSDRLRIGPSSARTRVTAKHRTSIVELYVGGMSALAVAEEVGVAKATVLRILRQGGVGIRPQGRHSPSGSMQQ